MLIKLPGFWIAILNIVGWLAIQLGLACLFMRLPARWFSWQGRPKRRRGRLLYERVLCIKSWKDRLPDGARWFQGGFAKGTLASNHPEYLQRFVVETRRGEMCHWLAILCAPLFLFWNPCWGFLMNAVYALLANLPCIVALRYNRARLLSLLSRWSG